MIVGLSGVRADVIPWGIAQGPLANLVGINVVGLRRRGFAKADIHRAARGLSGAVSRRRACFATGLARIEETLAGDRLIGSVLAFIRSGKRPWPAPFVAPAPARNRKNDGAGCHRAKRRRGRRDARCAVQRVDRFASDAARDRLRQRHGTVCGRRGGHAARPPRGAVSAARLGRRRRPSRPTRITGLQSGRSVDSARLAHRKAAATSCLSAALCGRRSRQLRLDWAHFETVAANRPLVPRGRRSSAVGRRPRVREFGVPDHRRPRGGAGNHRSARHAGAPSARLPRSMRTSSADLRCWRQ